MKCHQCHQPLQLSENSSDPAEVWYCHTNAHIRIEKENGKTIYYLLYTYDGMGFPAYSLVSYSSKYGCETTYLNKYYQPTHKSHTKKFWHPVCELKTFTPLSLSPDGIIQLDFFNRLINLRAFL